MNVLLQLLSLFSRLVNVVHGGKANKTFSERTHDDQKSWYFGAWRKVINAVGRLFGQAEHTLKVTLDEEELMKRTLRGRGYRVERAPAADGKASKPVIGQVRTPPIGGHATRVYEGAAQFELNHVLWKELSKDDQWSWEEAIREADHDQMVKFYSDDALRKIDEWGTLFAFNDEVAASINDASGREYSRRYPTKAPKGHGMADDGGQE